MKKVNKHLQVKEIIFFLILIGLPLSGWSQSNSMIDSLKNLLKNPPNDSLEARWNNSLMGLYAAVDLDTAIHYGERAKEIGTRIGDHRLLASNMLNFGGLYWYQSEFTKAMECFTRAASIFDSLGYETDVATARMNIGSIYMVMGELQKAEPYFESAYLTFQEHTYEEGLAHCLHYLGYIKHSRKQYDSAIYFLEKSLTLSRKLGLINQQAWATSGLGESYKELGDYKKSRDYLLESLQLEELQGNTTGTLQSNIELGSLEKMLGNYEKAEKYFDAVLGMEEIKENFVDQTHLFNEYVDLFERAGQIEKAFAYHKKLMVASDSLRVRENRAKLDEINEKYETAEKEARISSLEEEQRIQELEIQQKRRENLMLITAAVLLLAIVILITMFLVQIRRRKREVDARNETITKINKALNKSQDELQQSNKTKDKFFALVAHDLRGPVTSMQGIGRMLSFYSKKGDENRVNQLISQVDQSAQSVNHLLDNLLKWALSQTHGLTFHPIVFDLKQLVEECRIIFEENLKAKQIELSCQITQDTLVEADYNMISTTLRNLLSNAIKFSPAGGQIKLAVALVEDRAEISISDAGAGMPKKTVQDILHHQPVLSIQGTQNEKGTGLGLTLCREFVMKHGAELKISTSSSGTTISFSLQLVTEPANA